MRKLTAEQIEKRDARKARFKQLGQQIAAMSDAQRDELAARMLTLFNCEGKALSFHNRLMLAFQMPEATMVGRFRQWLIAGRCVKKGESGLFIWVPVFRKSGNDDASAGGETTPAGDGERPGFIMGTVFDVSQTIELTAGVTVGAGEE